jgi:hypothetical protein
MRRTTNIIYLLFRVEILTGSAAQQIRALQACFVDSGSFPKGERNEKMANPCEYDHAHH